MDCSAGVATELCSASTFCARSMFARCSVSVDSGTLGRRVGDIGGSFCATDLSGAGELANTKVHVSLGVTYVGDLLAGPVRLPGDLGPVAGGSGHPRRRRWTRKGGSPVSSCPLKERRQELTTSTPLGAVWRAAALPPYLLTAAELGKE